MVLNVHEGTNTTDIVSTDDEDVASVLALDNAVDFIGLEVELKKKSIKYKIQRKLDSGQAK